MILLFYFLICFSNFFPFITCKPRMKFNNEWKTVIVGRSISFRIFCWTKYILKNFIFLFIKSIKFSQRISTFESKNKNWQKLFYFFTFYFVSVLSTRLLHRLFHIKPPMKFKIVWTISIDRRTVSFQIFFKKYFPSCQ